METSHRDRQAQLSRLATYVPFHEVLRVCRGERVASGLDARVGSVLIADLSGFTALSESYAKRGRDGIDELTQLLNAIFASLLNDAVFPYDGFLVKFAGDALLAFFDGQDHARRASAAALAAQDAMSAISGAVPANRRLAIRIGVGSGPFHLYTVGAPGRALQSLCAGPASGLALEAVDEARAGEIVLKGAGVLEGRFGPESDLRERVGPVRRSAPPEDPSLMVPPDRIAAALEELRPFVPPAVFEAVARAPSAVAVPAERRHASAVFAELGEWTTSPEALSEHFLTACEAAERHGGTVNKLDGTPRGPRLLATFGVPSAHGDDERRAVAFALDLRDRLQRIQPRVGLESGPMFAGEVGSRQKREFTVMGDTVNVAARLLSAARPGQILCGPDCWSRTAAFMGRPTPPLSLKGKSEPITAMEVLAGRRMTGNRLVLRVGHPQLIGRDDELQYIERAAEAARAGGVQAITVLGARGTGKSALVGVAVDRWLAHGGQAFSARCEYDRRDVAYGPVRALVAAILGLPVEKDPSEQEVRDGLKEAGLGDEGLARELAQLLDSKVDRPVSLGEMRLFASRMIAKLTQRAPLLIVIEDSHNADEASGELFAYALEQQSGRVMFLTTARPEPHVLERIKNEHHGMLELRPLEPEASRALLARALQATAVSDRLAQAVESRAHGNPFVVLRLAGWLAARGVVQRLGGMAELSARELEDTGGLPPDLESLVHAEMDQLPASTREVLRSVCVLGQQFAEPLALALLQEAGMETARARQGLEALARDGLLLASGGAPPTYRFARLIDREVIYAGLPSGVRRELHAHVAKLLVAAGERVDRVATHYDAADDHPRAAESCLDAARRAFRRGAASDALRLFRAARRHLAAMAADQTDCRVAEIECLSLLASYGDARREAVALAETLPVGVPRSRALITAAKCACHEGDFAAAMALDRRARAELPPEAPQGLRANLLIMSAMNQYGMGELDDALASVRVAQALAIGTDLATVARAMEAGLLAEIGRTGDAFTAASEAVELAMAQRKRGSLALALVYMGRALDARGEKRQARIRYREAQRIYEELNQPVNAANSALHAAEMDLELGSPKTAVEQMVPVLETSRHFAAGQLHTAVLCSLGRARFVLGDLKGAVRDLEQAVKLSETTLEHHAAVCGRAWLAEALWAENNVRARTLLDAALRTGKKRGLVLELAGAKEVARRVGVDDGGTAA